MSDAAIGIQSTTAAGGDARPPLTALPPLVPDTPADTDWAEQVTSMAIIRLDAAGLVRTWNRGAEAIKGFAAAEIIGSSFERFYRRQDRDRALPARLLEKAAREGTAESTGWRVRADGSLFWAHVVITAIRAEDGSLAEYVKITRDLSARKAEEERRLARTRAFAHDFLSPVTALRGYVDLLEEAAPEQADLLARVATVSDHLVAMTAQLSAFVRGAEDERTELVDVMQLVYEAGELTLPGESFERLRTHGDDALQIRTYPAVLRRALANLIDNAAKYSEDEIEVTLSPAAHGVSLRVADRGRGIAPADLPTIFEPYARGSLADPNDGGTGVGLASVKDMIARLGGQVEISSTLDAGTTLTLHLPCIAPAS
jgi:PAS domain S-box-containing protein